MSLVSLWAGRIEPPDTLPEHLHHLYGVIGRSVFDRDPEVCAELEPVPIAELIEPFSLGKLSHNEAVEAANRHSLRLANTVVAVYTDVAPNREATESTVCDLRFIGTFPNA